MGLTIQAVTKREKKKTQQQQIHALYLHGDLLFE
jgi:hypothetical protein